jgi:repressor LexA
MEPLGTKLRHQRRSLGMTLDDLAAKASISKPYLSLIETGRVPNPPSDEKLRRLEQSLGFSDGELVSHAHLHRTPVAVRAILSQLLQRSTGTPGTDDQQFARLIEQLAEKMESKLPAAVGNLIPIVNAPSAGYPRGFNNLSFPATVAAGFVGCPDLTDKEAFAIRVVGDRMTPKYRAGDIVIFSPAVKVHNGDDCFICFDDGDTAFKRIFMEKDDDGKAVVRLQPRNEKYRAKIVPPKKIAAMYRAVQRQHVLDSTAE